MLQWCGSKWMNVVKLDEMFNEVNGWMVWNLMENVIKVDGWMLWNLLIIIYNWKKNVVAFDECCETWWNVF
jgi:hypothetical protein